MLYRAAIWTVWRNYMKDRSENAKRGTPAMALGILKTALRVEQVLGARLHPERFSLCGWAQDCYFGRIPTRAIEKCAPHRAKYAV